MTDYDVAQLARLEPAYQERLGLDTAPFPPTHEDRFLYLDAERRQRLQMLQHLTQYSNLLLLLIGEHGVGKTSLLDRFVAEARPEWQICRIQANALMDADQLLYEIAAGFGLPAPPHEPAALQDSLFQHLLSLRERDRTPILIIDDAHELSRDALLAVFHLADAEAAEGNLLRCILACEPAIASLLGDPAIAPLHERLSHTIDLPPFDAAATADYLAHRLRVAGLSGASPFTDEALEHIWQRSKGVPARINEAAHLWLSDNSVDSPSTIEPESDTASVSERIPLPRRQLIAAGGIALVLALVLIFQDRINRLFDASSTPPPKPTVAAPTNRTTVIENTPHKDADAPANVPPPSIESTEPLPAEVSPVDSEPPPTSAALPAPVIERVEPAVVSAGTDPVTLTLSGRNFTADSRIVIRHDDQTTPLPSDKVTWIDTRTARFTLVPGTTPTTLQVQVYGPGERPSAPVPITIEAKRPPATAPSPPQRVNAPATLWDRAWIDRQPPNHYTLQLLSTRNRASVERFVTRHGLKGQAVAFETHRNGQTWYSVIVGSYADREQARQAFRDLPSSVQTLQPWIRRFAGIQARRPERGSAKPPAAFHQPPPDNLERNDHLAWLWSRDPSHYTLQLIAGHDEAGIRRFMQKHRLLGKAAYYRKRRAGRDVFVVVYGDYADRKAARAAIASLAIALRKQKPWPRRFGDIHAELDAR